MARYTGPRCKRARAVNIDLELTSGVRTIEEKCKFGVAPGSNGQRRSRTSDYGIQLKMKQTIRNYYVLLEKQFKINYERASRMQGATGNNLLLLLERRLDNIVYRLGFASTRSDSRQLVSHGHVLVNGKRVNIASYLVSEGDIVELKEASRSMDRVIFAAKMFETREKSDWLEVDHKSFTGKVLSFPTVEDFPSFFKVNLVVEFYSK
jgi:small subunit ribosomal protein S4|tara:strand:+ start:7416 stop:8036 length:621 start_codon:yes stop_codon:yes gene_type:complete